MKLTKRAVEAVEPSSERDLWMIDDELPALTLRVKPSGVRTYVLRYRNANGVQRKYAIGRHGVVTAAEARRRAREHLAEIARGADPAETREEKRRALTVADLADRYLREHAATKKKPSSAAGDARNLRLHVVPRLGRRPVAEVTRAEVTRLHHDLRETPGNANRVLSLLSKAFNLAERWGLRPDGSNPCRNIDRYPERKRERYLTAAELARLGETLREIEAEGSEHPSTVAGVRLLIFTGCRRGEIEGLRRDEVDFERAGLRLADSKTGAKWLPLNAPALEVLASLTKKASDNPYVLTGRTKSEPFQGLGWAWRRIRQRAGLDDVRLHDLRHAFASVGVASGASLYVIGGLLGHRVPATTARYAHLADDPLRAASQAIGARIAAALDGKPAAPVIPLRDTK
ncbi:MAG: site-specific integrase [Deltaproteobacteria bacterium]|nr:site-specific integrase [Deltaproteobacteria bacterium]